MPWRSRWPSRTSVLFGDRCSSITASNIDGLLTASNIDGLHDDQDEGGPHLDRCLHNRHCSKHRIICSMRCISGCCRNLRRIDKVLLQQAMLLYEPGNPHHPALVALAVVGQRLRTTTSDSHSR